jgi:transposase
MSSTQVPLHEQSITKRRKRRNSKLDGFYYTIAQLVLENSKARALGKHILTLENMAKALQTKHSVRVHKSTLCRYLSKHKALKLL